MNNKAFISSILSTSLLLTSIPIVSFAEEPTQNITEKQQTVEFSDIQTQKATAPETNETFYTHTFYMNSIPIEFITKNEIPTTEEFQNAQNIGYMETNFRSNIVPGGGTQVGSSRSDYFESNAAYGGISGALTSSATSMLLETFGVAVSGGMTVIPNLVGAVTGIIVGNYTRDKSYMVKYRTWSNYYNTYTYQYYDSIYEGNTNTVSKVIISDIFFV